MMVGSAMRRSGALSVRWVARFALPVAVLVSTLGGGSASAGTSVQWAKAAPGLAQLPGADACYAQRDEESENAALCKVGKGLMDAAAPLVSPDGKSVYVASWGSSAIGVFTRSSANGRLTEIACISHNGTTGVDGTAGQCTDGDALWGATALAISPDGKSVYAASYASGGVAEFSRDPVSGRLRQFGCVRPVPTCTGARGLGGASSIAVSPDGLNVYVAAAAADAVASLVRDPATGALKGIGCISDDGTDRMCDKGNALRGPSAVTVSPDGKSVYVAAADSSSVLTFARDPSTGKLRQSGCVMQAAPKPGSCTRANGLVTPTALALSPDGTTLFVASYGYGYDSGSVAVFARNRATGLLSERGCVSQPTEDEKDGCVHVGPLLGPTGISVSPDGLQLYVTGESGLTVFARDRSNGGLQVAGCVSYAAYYDDEVTKACQLGRGVAEASGVTTTPDGHNVYLTASGSDSVATFITGVATSLLANLKQRRLSVSISCPASHETPCQGRISILGRHPLSKPYAADAGTRQQLTLRLSAAIVRAARHHAEPILVAASDTERLPVLRRITLGAKRPPHTIHLRTARVGSAMAMWLQFRQTFCAPGAAASWCDYVNAIHVGQTTLTGVTSLDTPGQAHGAATRICLALSTIAKADNPRARITSIRVLGAKGKMLVRRSSLARGCPGK
jgi:DNA-binding beta-propeller fold protein YncE